MKLKIAQIFPNPQQPRKDFDPVDLQVLAESIKDYGVINPISVEGPHEHDSAVIYILIDGERRWRAARLAGLTEIEASVREPMNGTAPKERLIMATVANLQRADMNAIEKAKAFQEMREFGMAVVDIAKAVGMHESSIHNYLAILSFEPEIQNLYQERLLPVDSNTIAAIRSLPATKRVSIISRLAQQKVNKNVFLSICKRAANASSKPDVTYHKKSAPAMQAINTWNALNLVDTTVAAVTISWALIGKAAKQTCESCPLFDTANARTCRDCPAVELLKRLTE